MSLYGPAWTKTDQEELIFQVIRENPFATLVAHSIPPEITHAPILLDVEKRVLRGHLAKPNPVASHLAEGGATTVIFHGPHAYITPHWYSPETRFVPTWNYVVVHVTGRGKILEGEHYTNAIVELTEYFETDPPIPLDYLEGVRNALVAFEISIDGVDAKFKLSQNKSMDDRESVMKHLDEAGDDESRRTAAWMKRIQS